MIGNDDRDRFKHLTPVLSYTWPWSFIHVKLGLTDRYSLYVKIQVRFLLNM